MAEDALIAGESGFEIHQREDRLYFVNRDTFGFAIATWILGGLAFIFGAAGIVLTATVDIRLFPMILVSCLLASIAIACFRRYSERAKKPWDQVANQVIADRAAGTLKTKDGRDLCRLSEIKIDIRLDPFDSTRGFMRWVLFSWPGGKVRIFKTNSMAVAKDLAARLGTLISSR